MSRYDDLYVPQGSELCRAAVAEVANQLRSDPARRARFLNSADNNPVEALRTAADYWDLPGPLQALARSAVRFETRDQRRAEAERFIREHAHGVQYRTFPLR